MIGYGPALPPSRAQLDERDHMSRMLADLCGVERDEAVYGCSRAWCAHFDEERGRCGLLVWDVAMRLGPEALRWFVAHRVPKTAPPDTAGDDPLRARVAI